MKSVRAFRIRNPFLSGLVVDHSGTELSFRLTAKSDQELTINFPDGKEKIIRTVGRSKIDMYCPSIEGTVILVFFKNNTQSLYDVVTGELIDKEFLEKAKQGRRCLPKITFYN
jgi:hypothetical protein